MKNKAQSSEQKRKSRGVSLLKRLTDLLKFTRLTAEESYDILLTEGHSHEEILTGLIGYGMMEGMELIGFCRPTIYP